MIFAAAARAEPLVAELSATASGEWTTNPVPCPEGLHRRARGCRFLAVGDDLRVLVTTRGRARYAFDADGDRAIGEDEALLPLGAHRWGFAGPVRVRVAGEDVAVDVAGLVLSERGGELWIPSPTRAGTVGVGDRDVAVALSTEGLGFVGRVGRIAFDTDADGRADPADGLEARPVTDGTVKLADAFWSFRVSPDGATVTLAPGAPSGRPERGERAPTFRLEDLEGTRHTNESLAGRWTVLDFWGTWCQPCADELPALEALVAERDLAVLGIAADARDALTTALAERPSAWPQVPADDHPVLTAFGVDAYPTYALLDPEGRIRALGRLEHVSAALP